MSCYISDTMSISSDTCAPLDVILRRSPKFLGPRETLPPPVEEGDVLNPPENREPTSGTVAVDPSVYNVLQILREV